MTVHREVPLWPDALSESLLTHPCTQSSAGHVSGANGLRLEDDVVSEGTSRWRVEADCPSPGRLSLRLKERVCLHGCHEGQSAKVNEDILDEEVSSGWGLALVGRVTLQ